MKRLFLFMASLAALAALGGCAAKTAPVYAAYEAAPAKEVVELERGRPATIYRERWVQPSWLPRVAMTPTSPGGAALGPLPMGEAWVAWARLEDGTLLLSAPETYVTGLALAVGPDGRVAGLRPWFDLKTGRRPAQPVWEARMRAVFSPAGEASPGTVLDLFETSGTYHGLDAGRAVLELNTRKRPGCACGKPAREVRLAPGEPVSLGSALLTAVEAGPAMLRLAVATEPEAPSLGGGEAGQ